MLPYGNIVPEWRNILRICYRKGIFLFITSASIATATRDLADLTEEGTLVRAGELKGRRYHLSVPPRPTPRAMLDEQGKIVAAGPSDYVYGPSGAADELAKS